MSSESNKSSSKELEEKVFAAFKQCFQLEDDVSRDDLIYQQTQDWDSVGHMSLVAGLEEQFDCMMDTDDILDMSSYAKAVEIMGKY